MAITTSNQLILENFLLFAIIALVVFSHGCTKASESENFKIQSAAPANISSGACIDLEGQVFGDIIPQSAISLNEISNFNLSHVLAMIRSSQPVKRESVNTAGGFKFSCLSSGKYAFVISTTSYNGSIGYPLPYEFDCRNLSLRIVFQGGNSQFAIGVLWIKNASAYNRYRCAENPFVCRLGSGSHYKECHLESE